MLMKSVPTVLEEAFALNEAWALQTGLALQGITVRKEKISMTQDQAIEQPVADEIPMKVLFANPVSGKVQNVVLR